jgi:hypothetical protein
MKSSVVLNFPAYRCLKMKWCWSPVKNPRLNSPLRENDVYNEQHAVVALDRYASFSLPWYDTADKQASVAYQGMAMVSVLNVVSQTAGGYCPRWLAEEFAEQLKSANSAIAAEAE